MISVIIPTLNEEKSLPSLLQTLMQEDTDKEIIVVDGGSRDNSIRLAQDYDVKVLLISSPGRGAAICQGVNEASGDVLLFLHADTLFPAGGLKRIEQMLTEQPELVGGNFRLLFDGDTAFSRWLTSFYAWIRWCGLYYGDSGIFVRRSAYDALDGIRPIPIMEDIDFVRRLEWFGKTCCILEPSLITSSRRFQGRRSLEIVYGWIKLHVMFYLGASPERLAQIYATHAPPKPRADSGHVKRSQHG